ncbi:MAG: dihydroorotase [Rhodospirillales bacterium]|nr:dihydroorotase [Rhodospirillales bacterium]
MPQFIDLVLRGGRIVTPGGTVEADLAVAEGRIAAIGRIGGVDAREEIRIHGLTVLPGVIDPQVHFREPGLTHKEDLATGTAAAVKGGVTTVFEMPNTIPPTITAGALADKLRRAEGRAWCDHAFFVGATEENAGALGALERLPGCAGVKMFMGSSTGTLLVGEDEGVEAVLRGGRRRIAVHAEDEARLRERLPLVREGADPSLHPVWRDEETALRASLRLLTLARRWGRPVHLLHVSTAEEMDILARHKDIATVEVTPQHLTLTAPDCYRELGTLAQMNPPIRDARHRDALWRGIEEGIVDCLGSDHAPHTREEKARLYPTSPSGMPGVETMLPIMLDQVAAGRLSLERLVDLTGAGPARVYGIAAKGRLAVGYDADLVVVDLKARKTIQAADLASRCGWTPFEGRTVTGWPIMTLLRGAMVMREGALLGHPCGRPVRFLDTLPPAQENSRPDQ